MEHKSVAYSVFEGSGGVFWWTVSLATGDRVGEAPSRAMAILQAIKTINKDQRLTKAAARRKAALLLEQSKIRASKVSPVAAHQGSNAKFLISLKVPTAFRLDDEGEDLPISHVEQRTDRGCPGGLQ